MKIVRRGSAPLETATGLEAIKVLSAENDLPDLPGGLVTCVEDERAA
jgi:phosphomannomutase